MFGVPPLRSAQNQYSSAKARHVQTAMSQRSARAAVSAIVARLQGEKLWSERLLDTDSHTSTKSPHNTRSRPGRPVTRTAPVGAIQYQAAARSRAGGVELGVESLATSTTGRAALAVVRCRETPKAESAYRHGVVRVPRALAPPPRAWTPIWRLWVANSANIHYWPFPNCLCTFVPAKEVQGDLDTKLPFPIEQGRSA